MLGRPPPLPDSFPAAASAAIARAMAKRPEDRFQSAAEFAAAIAPAPTLGAINLPRLDELTRDNALLAAPQPISEAVVLLDAATDALAAYTAVWHVLATISNYVGVVALAARARVRGVDSEPALSLLNGLRAEGLSAKSWWSLPVS